MKIISAENGKKLNIEEKETYRYLGYHFGGEVPADDELKKLIDELTDKLKDVITPRCAYELYRLEVKDNVCRLFTFDPGQVSKDAEQRTDTVLSIHSRKLSAHIKECRYAVLLAATVGPGADMLIRRYSGRSTIKPAILQAAGAAAIEAFADEVTEVIRKELSSCIGFSSNSTESSDYPEPVKFKMRFSPGYGDFSLEHQKDFFELLKPEKNLGMSLNSALLMSPSKSITAIIGVI